MIPRTVHNLPALEVLSGMQKSIRRAHEEEAMMFAVELMHTSKAFNTMVCNRLEVISHEDIDTMAQPVIIPYVRTCAEQARAWYDPKKMGRVRMAVGNAIRLMARAPKSREGDHFQAAIGLANEIEGWLPQIEDWMLDHHTQRGKRKGRGLTHFRKHSTKLVPQPDPDPYEDEAYRLWELKKRGGK